MNDDETLLGELGRLLGRVAGPPSEVVTASRGLFTWRTVDAELAELVHDSLVEAAAGTRAGAQPRILTFETDGLTVEVEVDETPGARRLLGQLVPAEAAELELRSVGEPVRGRADEMGRFVLALPAQHTRASLRCVRPGGAVDTAWVIL